MSIDFGRRAEKSETADVITPEEQDAIADFLSKNKITKIPSGRSGLSEEGSRHWLNGDDRARKRRIFQRNAKFRRALEKHGRQAKKEQ